MDGAWAATLDPELQNAAAHQHIHAFTLLTVVFVELRMLNWQAKLNNCHI